MEKEKVLKTLAEEAFKEVVAAFQIEGHNVDLEEIAKFVLTGPFCEGLISEEELVASESFRK